MIDQYSYLWNEPGALWCLFDLERMGVPEEERYSIVNLVSKEIISISDDRTYSEVKRKMLAHGVRIINASDFKNLD